MSKKTVKPKLVLTQPGKGGVGKTTVAAILTDYYAAKGVSSALLDADERSGAGLAHFHATARRFGIQKRDALDELATALDGRVQVVFCDMPAAREAETTAWFRDVAEGLREVAEIVTVCVVSPDPGSIPPVLQWASEIRENTSYVLVRNEQEQPECDWHFWAPKEAEFLAVTEAEVLTLKSVNPDLQAALRVHGETLARVSAGTAKAADLQKLVWKIRANTVWADFFRQLEQSKFLNP